MQKVKLPWCYSFKDVNNKTSVSRKGLSKKIVSTLFFVTFIILSCNSLAQSTFTTKQSGPFDASTTWLENAVPANDSKIIINHTVTVTSSHSTNNITINAGGGLDVRTNGIITLGAVGGDNKTFTSSGTLTISGGTLNVNGNILINGGIFNMASGSLTIDPNNGTVSSSAQADVFTINGNTTSNVTGGTITFLDPSAGNYGSFIYKSDVNSDWTGNNMIFGNGTATLASGNTNGFYIDTKAGTGWVMLGNVRVKGGLSTEKKHLSGSSNAANGFDIGGDLTVEKGAEVRDFGTGAMLTIRGNLSNEGLMHLDRGISFSNRNGSNTKKQLITGEGRITTKGYEKYIANVFQNLIFDNTWNTERKAVNGPAFTFETSAIDSNQNIYIIGNANFKNGTVSINSAKRPNTQMFFMESATASRTNGFFVSSSSQYKYGLLVKLFPSNKATTFTFYIADPTDIYDPSFVTVTYNRNDKPGRTLGIKVFDAPHPKVNAEQTQTDFLSRYWILFGTVTGTFNFRASFQYSDDDLVGNADAVYANIWSGSAWSQAYSKASNNQLVIDSLTETSFPITNTAEITGRFHQATIYKWKAGVAKPDWQVASNWTPERRTMSTTDVLLFDNLGTLNINNVRRSESLAELKLSGNTHLTLLPDTTTEAKITLIGGTPNVLDIPAGTSLTLKDYNNHPIGIDYLGAQQVDIRGTLTLEPGDLVTNTYNGINCFTTISGTLNNGGLVTSGRNDSTGTYDSLSIPGTYNHIFKTKAGSIPFFVRSDTTKINITGYTNPTDGGTLTGLNQYFPKITYNCPNQTGTLDFKGVAGTSIDSLIVISTGSGTLGLSGTVPVHKIFDLQNGSKGLLSGTLKIEDRFLRTGTGNIFATDGSLEMAGTSAQSIPAGIFNNGVLKSLIVNNPTTVTLNSVIGLDSLLDLKRGKLVTQDLLTLRSRSIQKTARVAPIGYTSPVPITGLVTVERFIPAKRSYRFLSPGVTTTGTIRENWQEAGSNAPGFGTHITGAGAAANGFDPTFTNNPSLMTYENNAWKIATNTNLDTLYAGQAYRLFVRGDRTIDLTSGNPTPTETVLRAKGKIVYGDITYNKTGANNTPKLNPKNDTYTLIGNPYASPVNWDAILSTATDIRPEYYTIDPNIMDNGSLRYVTYNLTAGVTAPSTSKVNKYIQPGQAIFVRTVNATTKPNPNPSITFRESHKAATLTSVFRTAEERPILAIQLLGDGGESILQPLDGLVTVFDENFKASIGMEDSYKLTNQNESIAINRGGTSLSIEGRPVISSNDTLPLRTWQYRNKNYALKLEPVNFPPALSVFVKDAYLNQETAIDLQTGGTVPFTVNTDSASFAANRFMIVFKGAATLPVTIASITAYQKNKGIQVDWIAESENNVAQYQVEKSDNGQQFDSVSVVLAKGNSASDQLYGLYDAVPKEGNNFYRIKVIDKAGTYKYSPIVRVNLGSKVERLTIYPNPITNNTLGLQFSDLKKGNYTLNLYNNLGQKVFTNVVAHNGVSASYSISINTKINAGIYRLSITNGNTTLTQNAVFQ